MMAPRMALQGGAQRVGIKGVSTPGSGVQSWGEGCSPHPRPGQEPGREDEAPLTSVANEQHGSKMLPDCPQGTASHPWELL